MRGLGSLFALGATFLTMDTVLAAPATSNVGVALPPVHPIADYLPSNLTAEINDDLTFLGKTDAEIAAFHKSMSLSALEAAFVPSATCAVAKQTIWIDLYFRVYFAGEQKNTGNNGWATPSDIQRAIYKLNVDFKSAETGNARIRFRLGSGTGVNQAIYYRKFVNQAAYESQVLDPSDAARFKAAADAIGIENRGPVSKRYAKGVRQLYIYVINDLVGARGVAIRPGSISAAYVPEAWDGVFIPRRYFAPLAPATDTAKLEDQFTFEYAPTTLTHEVAHTFGLAHTHEGGCTGKGSSSAGDFVADTIPWKVVDLSWMEQQSTSCAAYATWSKDYGYPYDPNKVVDPCNASTAKSTVRNAIANYMSYSKSKCRSIFTQGQRKRMYLTLTVARKYVPVCTSS